MGVIVKQIWMLCLCKRVSLRVAGVSERGNIFIIPLRRKDVAKVLKEHCNVIVDPKDVIFRFAKHGVQSDICFVIIPSVQECDHCIATLQEFAVPKRAAYGGLFGVSFIWSARYFVFIYFVTAPPLGHKPLSLHGRLGVASRPLRGRSCGR